jgi:hypothetical protein
VTAAGWPSNCVGTLTTESPRPVTVTAARTGIAVGAVVGATAGAAGGAADGRAVGTDGDGDAVGVFADAGWLPAVGDALAQTATRVIAVMPTPPAHHHLLAIRRRGRGGGGPFGPPDTTLLPPPPVIGSMGGDALPGGSAGVRIAIRITPSGGPGVEH